ncbi:Eco57I restriction-modification methylase domain-containing protein [Latilactobacillus sakei]|uniref:Eco57I restriction-modification methylase domain-containing protein n=1 Tax=Latilactobacillus sakei TaxID=1599 RepID=UPI001CFBE6F2|nr:N-6 DNA methylase [Latilactobacillus sakei]MCB4409167.1 N-6 DNA methylase [Latilactobacillus sakei]
MSNSELLANERSEGGELIVEMNLLFDRYDWGMKSAVGELSLKTEYAEDDRNGTLFPDAVIFADVAKSEPLMGWEFKMPDVKINNQELYSNALDKARRMGTQVFVLWNFQYAAVYVKDEDGWPMKPTRFFREFDGILTNRQNVHSNKNEWKKQLYDVLAYLNSELLAQKFEVARIEFNIGNYVSTIANKLSPAVATNFLQSSDTRLKARMRKWRKSEQAELIEVGKNESDEKVADAFARNVIIRWVNRIIFAHLLKSRQNVINNSLVQFSKNADIAEFAKDLNLAVNKTDFYTILHVDDYEDELPRRVAINLNEFNLYLANTDFSHVSENFVSRLLESLVDVTVRELMGLYTTPVNLAKFLVGITIQNTEGNFADVTTGSGTIAHAIQNILKSNGKSEDFVHNHVWASDRYGYPLQIANLNLTSPDSLNLKNIVFQHNALSLRVGEKISIVDPALGILTPSEIPTFDYIISNLPFVGSNDRNDEDQSYINKILERFKELDDKTDLYQAIILHLASLLDKQPAARVGVITSNSWTKVQKNYKSFFKTLTSIFDVEMIVQPKRGRWFQNATVTTNILVLKLKTTNPNPLTRFIMIKEGLTSQNGYVDKIDDLIDDIKLDESNDLYGQQVLALNEVTEYLNMGISVEAMFDDISWLSLFKAKMSPLSAYLEGGRGTRTGGDPIFIMDSKKVDDDYAVSYLKTIKDVSSFEVGKTGHYYFYTKDSVSTLEDRGAKKTLQYLESIQMSPSAVKRKEKFGDKWFNADQEPKYADFITSINPQDRYFWSRMTPRSAVNQRVTAFRIKKSYHKDIEVLHAILNSLPSQYMLAASGFGRGQGVTDLTKDGIIQIYIPSLDELSISDKTKIVTLWQTVKHRTVPTVMEQIDDVAWVNFNKEILKIYGVDTEVFDTMSKALVDLLKRRVSAKNVVG